MRKLAIIAAVLLLALVSKPVFCAEGGKKGASAGAYEHASEQAVFHRISDWFATTGKSPEEKAKILQERKAKRAVKRAQKEIRKSQKKMEKIKEQKQEESAVIRQRERQRERQRQKQEQRQKHKTKTRQRNRTR
ncbi:MAG: hypothetical protein KKH11_03300 [Candidatus Omnitrophica bacterium]|nr:hypothetical protein [Candidatus Omnitrophota bacterium]